MMKPTIYLCFLLLTSILFSCKEEEVFSDKYDVYISGTLRGDNYDYRAAMWKNGVMSLLNPDDQYSYTQSIISEDKDVYIIGYMETTNNESKYVYWKNGEANDIDFSPRAIAVDNHDVYVAGWEINNGLIPYIAKNGVLLDLEIPDNGGGIVGMKVADGSIHLIGFESIPDGPVYAKYWKDGHLETVMPNPPYYSNFTDIAVSEDKVHIVGYSGDENGARKGGYWVNGVETEINFSPRYIAIENNDVYILSEDATTYTKNGKTIVLPPSDSPSEQFASTGFQVIDGNVFVTAIKLDNQNKRLGSYIWQNGEEITPFLGDEMGVDFTGVAIVEK
ncbi:MAG: hypothetical protein CMB80_09935 [Flammeovirgaceae bacterium]|nr:hypothetical protein [Flammeovirgaceae bacterium]HCX20990.1 hypothetical protein [Cytophagales bacterium]|tara:strand:- start:7334 stop:8332 length:999 start_codon:yes stop_codon:yes gene_type:complete